MGCSNCFNGCADIVSDQCVKYTGIAVPGLGIATGDSLLVVETQIINKLLTLMTGAGIVPIINSADLCSLVSGFLPSSGTITLNHVISALFKSVCSLSTRVAATENTLTVLNADYAIGCLTGVTAASDTHAILQAVITKLCQVDTAIAQLSANLANYVLIDQIDDYIASYISGVPSATLINSKMVPYVAVAYFGLLNHFDITGAGIGDWDRIYLCNGQNLTPDLRGRALVGATTMGTNTYTDGTATNPANGNPTYDGSSPYTKIGANTAFLTSVGQIPLHSHTATVTINDPGHTHTGHAVKASSDWSAGGSNSGDNATSTTGSVSTATTGITATAVIGSTGGSSVEGHANIQPVHSTNYIMYIP